MASPEPPADTPEPGSEPGSTGIPLRTFTAWALIGVAALQVAFEFLEWVFPTTEDAGTARFDVYQFATIGIIVPPLLAMLVTTKLGPTLKNAKLMATIAVSTYAAAAVFGVIAFLVRLADHFDVGGADGVVAFGRVLQQLGALLDELLMLGLLALAGLWTYRIASSLGAKLPSVNIDSEEE